jgi:nucleoside deoxyribosyltransferase
MLRHPFSRRLPMTSIYLAGFDVFRKDAVDYGKRLQALCADHGFTGPETARWIYEANIALLHRADAVMANLDDFRGPGEPDSGTAFEVGYAVALGKPVWGYASEASSLRERVTASIDADGEAIDARGYVVEDFGLSKNLMLACSVTLVHGTAEDCLKAMAAQRGGSVRA